MGNSNSQLQTNIFIKGSLISFIGVVILGIVNYFVRRTLALNLSQDAFGFFYSAYSFISLFLTFIDLGMGYSLIILISKYVASAQREKINSIFSVIVLLKSILGIFLTIILILLSKCILIQFFRYPTGYYSFILLSVFCMTSSLSGIVIATCNGFKNFLYSAIFGSITSIILLLTLIFFLDTFGLSAPALGFLLGSIVVTGFGYYYIYKKYSILLIFSFKKLKISFLEIWHAGKWIPLGLAGIAITYYMDTVMLTHMTSLREVGLYNIALPIMQIFQVLMVFPNVFIPIASTLWVQKNEAQIGIIANGFITLMIFATWGIFIFVFIMGENIITILFSVKYIEASHALVLLCVSMGFYVIAQFFTGILNSMSKAKLATFIIFAGLIGNIILNLILIPVYGIVGAATATCFSYIFISITGFFCVKSKVNNLKLNKKSLMLCMLAGILCIVVILLIESKNNSLAFRSAFTLSVELLFCLITLPLTIPIVLNLINNYKMKTKV